MKYCTGEKVRLKGEVEKKGERDGRVRKKEKKKKTAAHTCEQETVSTGDRWQSRR